MKNQIPPSNPKALNLGLEIVAMRKKFPGFQLTKGRKTFWIGTLQPSKKSDLYQVKVVYNPYIPKVFILDPHIIPFAPHRYPDLSLCLYHPMDNSFGGESLISDTIIPWTSEWLFFYEAWLEEGVWWGKEAPHSPTGKTDDEVR
ncbi:hypothetical protein ACDX78_07760 [Virgibacillus oceani]